MAEKKRTSETESIGFPGRRTPSLESTQSLGTGGAPVTAPAIEQSLLTPEIPIPAEAFGQHLYDSAAFVMVCKHHAKMAITKEKKGSWLPFVPIKNLESWTNTALVGASTILGHGDISIIAKMTSVPFMKPELIHVFRLQLPQVAKFVIRTTFYVLINATERDSWKCCTDDKRIQWVSLEDVNAGNVDNLLGPEVHQMTLYASRIGNYDIEEYSTENAMLFVPRDRIKLKEEELLKSAGFGEKEALKFYADFIQHCWPSHYMTKTSFTEYMSKIGYEESDITLHPFFRAFDYRGLGFISFTEFLLGLAAFDQQTQHGGHVGELRCGYVFRYYDVNNDGFLDLADIIRMVADISERKKENKNENAIEKEAKSSFEKMTKTNDQISFKSFLDAVGSFSFRGTSVLFRSPHNASQKIRSKRTDISVSTSGAIIKRRMRGSCPSCRPKVYTIAEFLVKMDIGGRIVAPQALSETDGRDIRFTAEDQLVESIRQHRRQVLFNPKSEANRVLNILRLSDEVNAKRFKNQKKWQELDINMVLNLVSTVCSTAAAIFNCETRCVKVASPCFVIGDICGNIKDLLTYERNLWKTAPGVCPSNYLFLGNYVNKGEFGVEVACYIFAMKILAPDKFFFIRGNHEIRSIQKAFTFYKECMKKYGTRVGPQIFEAINKVFDQMPICAIVDEKIFAAHGGIPTSVSKIADLMKIPAPLNEPEHDSPAAWEMMWNDPIKVDEFNEMAELKKVKDSEAFLPNTKRGTGFFFSEKAVDYFLDSNGLTHVIRGHEVPPLGYKLYFDGKMCTVFSSSKHSGGTNEAAAIYLDSENMNIVRMDTSGTSTL